ncbi:hypothetical protein ACFVR1_00005, partial [Psychrobacillus sp. NPDC058041]|uniref:hypothetical protein n=1 Tax=Psychrobacillus sp. NPDC058041 TaxID=3346310 RepID=UPI0036DF8E1E
HAPAASLSVQKNICYSRRSRAPALQATMNTKQGDLSIITFKINYFFRIFSFKFAVAEINRISKLLFLIGPGVFWPVFLVGE